MKIKFLCLNLWQGGNFFNEIVEFIRKENPDIIAMQEVYDGHDAGWERKYRTMDELRHELNYPHELFAPTFIDVKDFGKIEQGNAILSKYQINPVETTFFDIPYRERFSEDVEGSLGTPRNLQHAVVDVDGTSVHIFNTQGIWGLDGEDNDRRLAMSKTICEKIKDVPNVILTGDFNVQDHTKSVASIEEKLKNVFKNELKTTFNMRCKTNPNFASAVVDMLFVSQDMDVVAHSCPNVHVSDHLPLLATLEIPATQ